MKNKLTAKEYLLQEENCNKDIIQVMEEYAALKVNDAIKPLKEIENIMGRWHRERPDDKDTIWGITKVFVGIGMLGFWDDEKQGGNQ